MWSSTDATIGTAGPSLDVTRTYNSSDPRVGPFGLGWTFTYDMRWQSDSAGNITVLYPDGRRETYVPDGSLGWLAPEGYFSTLTGDENSGFTLTMKDDTKYVFNDTGALTSITDGNSNTVTLAYDETNGQLEQVKSEVSARSLWFTWDGDFITEVSTDPVAANNNLPYVWKYYYTGNELSYSCDPRDDTLPEDTPADNLDSVCYGYSYVNGKITEITKPLGNTDALVGYFPSGEVLWRRDGEGNETSFAKPDPNTVVITDARGNASTQQFDDKYRLVKETDAEGGKTEYRYDEDGNRYLVIDANLHSATMTYDDQGNMESVTNAEGETSYFQYDTDDNLIATRDGRSTGASDDTYKTTFGYDTVGNKTAETDPLGNTQTWEYTNDADSLDGGTAPDGLLDNYREARGNVGGVPDSSFETTYGYYINGDLASVRTPSGFETRYTYDEIGRLLTESINEGGTGWEIVATYTYDAVGNVKTVEGPEVTNEVSGEPHRLLITNSYDDNSNLTKIVESDNVGTDPSRITLMGYDLNDREISVTDPEEGVLT
ncbi:MAG: RHS repeat protein, partial [bacterium]|nr:RHS repeat protein [bacterium]